MASLILGRTPCPECGKNPSAHVKQSDKCLYRYCPECGAQYFARTPRQVEDLKAKTRFSTAPADATPIPPTELKPPAGAPAPTGSGATGTGDPPPPPPPPPVKRGLFF